MSVTAEDIITSNAELFPPSQVKLALRLCSNEYDQGHLFSHWNSTIGDDEKKKRTMMNQLELLDKNYQPGGLCEYINNSTKLLKQATEGQNPFDGWHPSVPRGENVEYGSKKHRELEKVGLKQAKKTAFVLVAGGLGERLGYKGIKVRLPVERATMETYLGLYVKSILAIQETAEVVRTSGQKIDVPLAIMTSEDTHAMTVDLLESNDYFGAKKTQITLMKQEKVPCLVDNDAHLALNDEDKYVLQTKPHGHGDVHSLLHQSGLLKKWKQMGVKWVTFFQDTNSLVFRVIPGALGVSKSRDFEFNSLCVPRKAKEAVGGIAQLTHTDGRKMTINVEYNQLDPLLRASSKDGSGDVNDPATGFSPYPGNINQLIVKLEPYEKQLSKTGGAIDEFVNPKYKDSSKTAFKSPTRLECMMQDYPKSLTGTKATVGFTVFDNWVGYSPVKNSPEDGKKKFDDGQPTHTATSGEFEFYNCASRILRLAGANVPEPEIDPKQKFNGMSFPTGSKVVLSPSFGCSIERVESKINNLSLTAKSVLIVEGDVSFENVQIDGVFEVKAEKGSKIVLKNLSIKNKSWEWRSKANAKEEITRLCGFEIKKKETSSLLYSEKNKTLVVDGDLSKLELKTY
jgi:UDP-sugar pyrophosphorylase